MVTAEAPPVNDAKAHELLRAAHDGSYRFPQGFQGFVADIEVSESTADSTTGFTGQVTVSGARETKLEAADGGELATWAEREVASMAGHRWPIPYEEGDGRWTLATEGEEGVLGQLIVVHDDPFGSRYRVLNGSISQVVRNMGPTTFTISMQQHVPASDGSLLPAAFTVSFWENGKLTRTDTYADVFTEVEGVPVPASRRVLTATDEGIVGRQLKLSNIRLRKAD